jgi:uncharacterized protein
MLETLMNFYKFTVKGHKNILGTHRNTLEFTKDNNLTQKGDCILGVSASFSFSSLKKLYSYSNIKVFLEIDGLSDYFESIPNSNYCSEDEIVFRRSEFDSSRTFGFRSTKAAIDIDRDIIERLKNPDSVMVVVIRAFDDEKNTIK